MDSSTRRWYPASASVSQYRDWGDDDLIVVYHKSSGDTHLLEPLAAVILEMVESAPCTSAMLATELDDVFQDEDQKVALEVIETTLIQLRGVGLVYNTPN